MLPERSFAADQHALDAVQEDVGSLVGALQPGVFQGPVVVREGVQEGKRLLVEMGDVVWQITLGRHAKHADRLHRFAKIGTPVTLPTKHVAGHLVYDKPRAVHVIARRRPIKAEERPSKLIMHTRLCVPQRVEDMPYFSRP